MGIVLIIHKNKYIFWPILGYRCKLIVSLSYWERR